jgi:hypothetical protein
MKSVPSHTPSFPSKIKCCVDRLRPPAISGLKAGRHPKSAGVPASADIARLFDHFVGTGKERWWNLKPERFRAPEIDDQFRLRYVLDRQVGWLIAL